MQESYKRAESKSASVTYKPREVGAALFRKTNAMPVCVCVCLPFAFPTGDLDITVFARYISERQRVHPSVEGRIRLLNSAVEISSRWAAVLLLVLLWLSRLSS